MNNKPKPDNGKRFLTRYLGLGSQLLAVIAIAVFAGVKADQWLKTSPLFTVALPLLMLAVAFYKLWQDVTNKKDNDKQL